MTPQSTTLTDDLIAARGPQLFLDMDGVLADFDRGYRERFGRVSDKTLDNVDWNLVRETPHFYRDLPPMPDMLDLWWAVCHLNPIVLTGVPSSVDEAASNKREWVDKHLGHDVHMIACLSKDKRLHGRPGDLLVDDWEKHKHAWIGMGGVWFTHTSAAKTIPAVLAWHDRAIAASRTTHHGDDHA